MDATGWLSKTVRGAIAGALKKKLGLKVGDKGLGSIHRSASVAARPF
jgi:hypothetical protein